MKKLAIGVVVTGGALLGLRRAMRHGHKLCDHCGGSIACATSMSDSSLPIHGLAT